MTTPDLNNQGISPIQYRKISAADAIVSAENRTITFSFSSAAPVRRWGWMPDLEVAGEFDEVVSQKADHWDLSRVKQKTASFLENHDRNQRLGTVQKVWFENDRGYATVKLRSTPQADQLLRDLEDDTAPGVSFGYVPGKYKVLEKAEYGMGKDGMKRMTKPPVLEARSIQLYEISAESIPADPSVGFGRSAESPIDLRTIEIEGEISEKNVVSNELDMDQLQELNQRMASLEATNTELRTALETAQSALQEATVRSAVLTRYTSLRRSAELLVAEAKLSRAEFDRYFSGDVAADVDTLITSKRHEIKLEVISDYLEAAKDRATLLPTRQRVVEELPKRDSGEAPKTPTGEDPKAYAERLIRNLPAVGI